MHPVEKRFEVFLTDSSHPAVMVQSSAPPCRLPPRPFEHGDSRSPLERAIPTVANPNPDSECGHVGVRWRGLKKGGGLVNWRVQVSWMDAWTLGHAPPDQNGERRIKHKRKKKSKAKSKKRNKKRSEGAAPARWVVSRKEAQPGGMDFVMGRYGGAHGSVA